MNYTGKLYGKIGRKYFDTGKTGKDWDELEALEKQSNENSNCNMPDVVGRSEQLVCPYCKGKNIEIRHREQSFRCIDCKEGWAN